MCSILTIVLFSMWKLLALFVLRSAVHSQLIMVVNIGPPVHPN